MLNIRHGRTMQPSGNQFVGFINAQFVTCHSILLSAIRDLGIYFLSVIVMIYCFRRVISLCILTLLDLDISVGRFCLLLLQTRILQLNAIKRQITVFNKQFQNNKKRLKRKESFRHDNMLCTTELPSVYTARIKQVCVTYVVNINRQIYIDRISIYSSYFLCYSFFFFYRIPPGQYLSFQTFKLRYSRQSLKKTQSIFPKIRVIQTNHVPRS